MMQVANDERFEFSELFRLLSVKKQSLRKSHELGSTKSLKLGSNGEIWNPNLSRVELREQVALGSFYSLILTHDIC